MARQRSLIISDLLWGLPGYTLIARWLWLALTGVARWGCLGIVTVSYLVAYPWLMHRRPRLRTLRGLDTFNQPWLLRKADSNARPSDDDRDDLEGDAYNSQQVSRSLTGWSGLIWLIWAWFKRGVYVLIAIPWLGLLRLLK